MQRHLNKPLEQDCKRRLMKDARTSSSFPGMCIVRWEAIQAITTGCRSVVRLCAD
jgi:hypothetical protein